MINLANNNQSCSFKASWSRLQKSCGISLCRRARARRTRGAGHGGAFSVHCDSASSHCLACGKAEDFASLADASSTASSGNPLLILDECNLEGASDSIFDKVEETVSIRLEVEEKGGEWRKASSKCYNLEYLKSDKVLLADFSELAANELTKSLLNDVYTLAGNLDAEELVVSISLLSGEKNTMLRNLIVFGFEATEGERYTSNGEVMTVSMEVNQEFDFVDLM
eukprot:TRINITY_DN337_c0_g1_i3.p1 TRINITY_DN337_c0_g1~~TRINITY_DN337_c0_g1_i3.p1  ORF type:complete len:224 (+),score=47.20 TRINITY_DN337_c0_g1_i3:157-828(+)